MRNALFGKWLVVDWHPPVDAEASYASDAWRIVSTGFRTTGIPCEITKRDEAMNDAEIIERLRRNKRIHC